ncbi:MAG: ABC transporter substrate-binding protein [Burkholderiaceae bacterium]|nr:ABC transporter substrate-binding protein [Burkholderiaceae bacterium]MCD8516678.1 ABC transporter substrate-binding protein [Burkholderiaceae bacterium]MCD8536279.1 ABC transporter substrate-binding protein [Burkholderiaceae bacterium]
MIETIFRVFLATALMCLPGAALALDKVVFATNWRAQPAHGGFYQALVDGTYERYGLKVEIRQGGPSINHRPALLAGRLDFIMSGNLLNVFDHYRIKAPTVAVAAIFQKDPLAFLAHPGQGYKTFADLAKAPVVFVSKDVQFTIWPWLHRVHGFRDESMRNYNYSLSPFIANPKSIQQAYSIAEPTAIESLGRFFPEIFFLADAGFSSYSTLIEARQETVLKRPDYVQRFVDASILGWVNYLYGDRSAANAFMIKENPELKLTEMEQGIALMKAHGIVNSGDAKTLGIGAMVPERVQHFYQQMVQAGLYRPDEVDLSKVVSYEFVNKGVGLEISGPHATQ